MAKEVVWTKIILETFLEESKIINAKIVCVGAIITTLSNLLYNSLFDYFFCKKFNIYNLKNVFFYNKNLFV